MAGGKAVTLRSLLGKPTIVDFMASTCPLCIGEIGELKKVREVYGDSITIISISVNPFVDTPESLAALAAELGADWTFAVDEEGAAKIAAYVIRIPRILILDSSGNVVFDHTGPVDSQTLIEKIETAMKAEAGEVAQPLAPISWAAGLSLVAAGAATALSPCALPLLLAYTAMWAAKSRSRALAALEGLAVACGTIIVFLTGLIAGVLAARAPTPAKGATTIAGFVVVCLGLVQLAQLRWRPLLHVPIPEGVKRLGPLGYGVAYGLASLGCSFPVFLSVVAYSAASGAQGLAYLAVYLASVFVSMAALALSAAALGHAALSKLARPSHVAQVIAALALIAAGAFLIFSALD